ncbi:RidA family protein [Helicobacter sp. 23-1044]
MQTISTTSAPKAIGAYSQGKIFGELIFTSGQIALTPNGEFVDGDVRAQTAQVLENLKAILTSAESNLQSVIKTTIFLTNIDDFAAVNEVYMSYFGAHKPARSTIAVKELPKGAKVEIECVAIKGAKC